MIDYFEHAFAGASTPFAFTLSANSIDPNIPSLASAAGWDGQQKLEVTITASLINFLYFRSAWSFPGGVELTISASTIVGGTSPSVPDNGGDALRTEVPVSIRNLGTIAGAGGGGGNGQGTRASYNTSSVTGMGGGGGRGRGLNGTTPLSLVGADSGGDGAYSQWSGPLFGGDTRPWAQGGRGGSGGGWGSYGESGQYGSIGGSYGSGSGESYPPTSGFAPGRAVVGNSLITWLATGTRYGAVV